MSDPNILWRIFRSLLYIMGAFFIIFLQILPTNFTQSSFIAQHSLFVWSAAFLHRRPGSTNDLSVVFVALIYMLYTDEGLALGAAALILMVTLLRRMRNFSITQHFIVEVFVATFAYTAIICLKNLILFIFLTPHFNISQLIVLSLSFMITYPILNFIIIVLVRSRKERSLAL